MKHFALIAVSCVALSFVACGDDEPSNESEKPETAKLTKPRVQPLAGPPPKRLVIEDLEEGSGPSAKVGDAMTVNYVGVDRSGREVYSSWERPAGPLTFELGDGSYFRGWDEGLEGMKAGGRRRLVVPSNLALGSGPLVYVVDLLAIDRPIDATQSSTLSSPKAARERTKPKIQVPNGPPPKKLVIRDLEEGSGAAAKSNDEIIVNFVSVDYRTGKQLESTWDQGSPDDFQLDSGDMIDGLDRGLEGMKAGGRRELIVPPNLAYGEAGTHPRSARTTPWSS